MRLTTPIRSALRADSVLLPRIQGGLAALSTAHAACIDDAARARFVESLDLDSALREQHADQPRWDYLVGDDPVRMIVGIEVHSARDGEVAAVIAKRRGAIQQLRSQLRPGKRIDAWYWLASGRVDFLHNERAVFRLAQNGIAFVGRRLLVKHLAPETGRIRARPGPAHRRRRP